MTTQSFRLVPLHHPISLLYSLIMYFCWDLNRDQPRYYFIFYSIITLTHISGMSLGNLAGIIAPNPGTAVLLALTLNVPWLLFGWYFINTQSLNTPLSWVKYISSLSRGHEALILNESDVFQLKTNSTFPISLAFMGKSGKRSEISSKSSESVWY